MTFTPDCCNRPPTARQGCWRRPSSRAACAAKSRCPAMSPSCARPTTMCATPCRCCAACKAALPPRQAWLRGALDEYIEEEQGHDEWILDDIAACGADADAVRRGAARPRHRGDGGLCLRHHRAAQPARASSAWCMCSKAPASRWRCWRPTRSRSRWPARRGLQLPAFARHAGPASTPRTSRADGPHRRTRATRPTSCTRHGPSTACTATCSAACRCPQRRAERRRGRVAA